ncbi:L-type lectin-domain containing receptor kinase IV.2 [Panicum miliaceum]|uniref:L-type lectin-domain containing receptor kinase IV.2 n=1 Tax=Panicum miliaceum TaxID=4540 RepID=A0A3L6TE91_PANMI|nr:L-type lectin-domain containing receptor kinase IV.2 [Panicum miliaceum]
MSSMRSPTTTLLRPLLLLIIICLNDSAVADLGFLYNGFAGSNLLRDGAASVTQAGILSLTTNSFDITGHGFHPIPLPFTGEDGMVVSFSSTFVFTITPSPSGRSGDGMALVISAVPDYFSSRAFSGAYLGLGGPYYYQQQNQFFAVELDTIFNREFKDIDDNHVGIDVGSMVSVFSTPAGYSYTEDDDNIISTNFEVLRLSSGSPMQVWVDSDGESMELNVTLALVPMYKPALPLPSYTVNMSDLPLMRERDYSDDSVAKLYVGFSAATGDRHGATHQVLGWSFNLGGPAPPLNYSQLPLKQAQQIQRASKTKNLFSVGRCDGVPCAPVVVEEESREA